MIKYRTFGDDIEELEVIKETATRITYIPSWKGANEQREARISTYHSWHNTWEEARAYLIHEQERGIEELKRQIDRRKTKITKLRTRKEHK